MATSSLGRLTLDLAVRLSEFTDGMSRAERETAERTQNMQASVTSFREHLANELGGTQIGEIFSSLNERFGSLEGGITRVSGALAGMAVGGIAVGLGALSKMAIETANADAQMAQFANRANVGVESFQVLSAAAKGLGYEQEQLADIFADMQEKLGEFSMTEGGGAADFFDALRNNTKMTDDQIREFGKTLQGKDGVEAVQILKDKMDELGTTSQEQRFVFESLASDLTNLLPLFENGGDLLAAYDEELRQAGIITSKEAIEQSRILAAQTQSVQQRFSVFGSELGSVMIPILGTLLQHFMAGGKQGSAFGTVVQGIGVIAKGVAAVILTFSTAIGMFGSTIGMVMAQIANLGEMYVAFNNADGLVAKGQALAQGFGNAASMGKDWWNGLVSDAQRADATMQALVNGQTGRLDNLSQINYLLSQQQKDYSKGIKINTVQAKENAKALEKQTAARDKNTKSVTALASATARLVGISGDTGIGSAHLDIRISGGSRRLTNTEIDRFQAGGKDVTDWRKTSEYGYRGDIGIKGASKYHKGVDFLIPNGTPITTKVPVKSVTGFYDKKGGGYVQRILFADGLSVDLLHQNAKAAGIRGGASGSAISSAKTYTVSSKSSAATSGISQQQQEAERLAEQRQREAERAEEQRHRQLEQDNRDRLSLTQYYATQAEKIESEHKGKLTEINRLYAKTSTEWARLTAEENQRYGDEVFFYQIESRLKYAEGEEKITLEHQKKLRQIAIDYRGKSEDDFKVLVEKANEQYLIDLENYRWAQGEKLRAQQALVQKLSEEVQASSLQSANAYLDASMKASMSPDDYARWGLQRDYNNQYTSLYGQYADRQDQINEKDDRGNFKIESETERNALLEMARHEHLNKLYVMESEHAEKVKALDEQQQASRTAMVGGFFSSLTSVTAAYFGEQSRMARAAAAMQQGYAVYQAMLAAPETYSNTLKSLSGIPLIGPYIAQPMAIAMAGMQVAQAAKLKGMTPPSIGGVAHGGMDYIPKETTFLLDKGERVLSPRQNKDLTRYLNERQANTGGNVNVYNNSSAQVTAERQPNGEVTIEVVDKMIKRSWGNVAQASSFESRQIQKHTTARFNRQ